MTRHSELPSRDKDDKYHNFHVIYQKAYLIILLMIQRSYCKKLRTNPCHIFHCLFPEKNEYLNIGRTFYESKTVGGSGVRLDDGPDIKLFILVGLGRSFFVCCLAHRGSTVGFLLLQCSSGVVRYPRDLQVSVATRSCRVLILAS